MKVVVYLLLLLTLAACEKDETITFTSETSLNPGQLLPVQISVYGHLTDNQGDIVANALVTVGNRSTRTDQEGLWRIDDATVGSGMGYLTFASPDHIFGSRTIYARQGQTYKVDVQLLSLDQQFAVNAATGGTVQIPGSEATVTFPAAAFAKTNGASVSGEVTVVAHYLDPSLPATFEQMPGDLRGREAGDNGEFTLLTSYGMMAVELFDASGTKVQLDSGKLATLRMPIPAKARTSAPGTIPLWYFDDARGYWIEEGSATRQGNVYVGQVSHFSFWNADIPNTFVQLCGSISFERVILSKNSTFPFEITLTNPRWGIRTGFVDSTGVFCGFVPIGETFILEVTGDCDRPIYTQQIGPFTKDTRLEPITIKPGEGSGILISGLAVCDGEIIRDGAAYLRQRNQITSAKIGPDGRFTVNLLSCYTDSVSLTLFDYASGERSAPRNYAPSSFIDAQEIEVCNTASLPKEYVKLTVNGVEHLGFNVIGRLAVNEYIVSVKFNNLIDNLEISLGGTPVDHTRLGTYLLEDRRGTSSFFALWSLDSTKSFMPADLYSTEFYINSAELVVTKVPTAQDSTSTFVIGPFTQRLRRNSGDSVDYNFICEISTIFR